MIHFKGSISKRVSDYCPSGGLISLTPPPSSPQASTPLTLLSPSLSFSHLQDDMHRVIDQQLMDKYQDEWRSSPSSLSGASKAPGGLLSRRGQRVSDGDKKLFSFFKKN